MKYVVRLESSKEFLRNEYNAHSHGVFEYRTRVIKRAQQFDSVEKAEAAIALFKRQLQQAVKTRRAFFKSLAKSNPNAKRKINKKTGKLEFVHVLGDTSYKTLHYELPKFRVQKLWTRQVTRTVTTAVDL